MSFFDEADEPRTETRTAPHTRRPPGTRGRPPRGRPPGGPPRDQQTLLIRRAIAAAAILIVLILIVLGVHSCQVSSTNSSLRDYNNNVSSLIQESDQTSARFFGLLSMGATGANATSLQNSINEASVNADTDFSRAEALSVPDQVSAAQRNLLFALQMRRDAVAHIAGQIQQALGTSTNKDAIAAIAAEMAKFYSSDVIYKDYTTTVIAAALHSAGIAVGGANGVSIESGQFLPDLQWLTPSFIASKLGSSVPASGGKPAPGTHGHSLDSVSVGGTTLQSGSTNTIAASPPTVFTLHFTNAGQNPETNVVLKVTVTGTSISGQTTVPRTMPGQSSTAQVTLSASPPAGPQTVVATVAPVPGEKDTTNNTRSFPVTFQ